MAGKKNLRVHIQDITYNQAANMAREIMKAKDKHAPDASAEMLIGARKRLDSPKRKELGSGNE